ncbi:hypothetical protein KPA96_13645 [Burkholderia cenocepacia]|uniref:DUF5906 domain-containing protein n=1 Tax=Burkholderia cenocepacia TaxID=95486 RepID=UPI002861B898|nr:DUF5906 domain-containing protein [Burkholderia cenocepacia]MDR8076700.1 hypothetical protein [Burkholderia cenocepacia]
MENLTDKIENVKQDNEVGNFDIDESLNPFADSEQDAIKKADELLAEMKLREKESDDKVKRQLLACVKNMQKKYSLINRNGDAFVIHKDSEQGLIFTKPNAFITLNMHHYFDVKTASGRISRVYATKAFLESKATHRYEGIIFNPIYKGTEYFNLWNGWTLTPKKGDVSKFLALNKVMAGNNEQVAEWLLNYWAHMIQRPEQLPRKAPVLLGAQGAGKGVYIDTIAKIVSKNYLHITNSQQLVGKFNGHQHSALLLFADESVFGADKVAENILKGMITECETMIEDKHKSPVQVKNFKRIVFASNNEQAAPVSEGDRRYVVSRVSDELKGKTGKGEFFDTYKDWIDNKNGSEAVFYFLLNRDISKFDVFNEHPKTQAWADMMKLNLNPEYQFIYEMLNDMEILSDGTKLVAKDGELFLRNNLYRDFSDWCKDKNVKYIPTIDSFGKAMQICFEFAKENEKWRTNWKGSDGYYYKCLNKRDWQKKFAENFMKADPAQVFFDYE